MKNKKTVLIFTDEKNAESAQAVKDYFSGDRSKLPIIIAEEEFLSIAAKLAKDRLLPEDGIAARLREMQKPPSRLVRLME